MTSDDYKAPTRRPTVSGAMSLAVEAYGIFMGFPDLVAVVPIVLVIVDNAIYGSLKVWNAQIFFSVSG